MAASYKLLAATSVNLVLL